MEESVFFFLVVWGGSSKSVDLPRTFQEDDRTATKPEVYSVDFDSRYKEEEYFLQVYDQPLGSLAANLQVAKSI